MDGPPEAILTYCTNVHPGETVEEVQDSLEAVAVPLQHHLAAQGWKWQAPFPVGLYLAARCVEELGEGSRRRRFAGFLESRGFQVVTLNCFPYGGFHAPRVKEEVFRPDWRDARRLEYTCQAATLLAEWLPEGAVSSISTLAGSFKAFGNGAAERDAVARLLARAALAFQRLHESTGREIVLSLEPEPGSTLETTAEVVEFFSGCLWSGAGREELVAAGLSRERAEELLRRYLGVCYDTCHQAVEFEEAPLALEQLAGAGVRLGKMQLSSALVCRDPGGDPRARRVLERFAEPRYLHQCIARDRRGALASYPDLPAFLAEPPERLAAFTEARVHFHVPIDRDSFGPLASTRASLRAALHAALERELTHLFEVETYTFAVLPRGDELAAAEDDLVRSLEGELRAAARDLEAGRIR